MKTILLSTLFAMFALVGCVSQEASPQSANAPHAECLVCKHNADLACVDVAVTPNTPHAQYQGSDYYFCSDECRGKFNQNPALYVKK
jgi:YHS domain-containing protein